MPAWALSFIIFVVSIISAFVFEDVTIPGPSTLAIIGSIFYAILIPAACFIICKAHPKSVWYTPIICNAPSIVLAISYSPDFWTEPMSLLVGSGFVLSVIGAIVGAKIGRRIINQA